MAACSVARATQSFLKWRGFLCYISHGFRESLAPRVVRFPRLASLLPLFHSPPRCSQFHSMRLTQALQRL